MVFSMFFPGLKWDKSPFVAHEILHPGGVQSRAFRDFLFLVATRRRVGMAHFEMGHLRGPFGSHEHGDFYPIGSNRLILGVFRPRNFENFIYRYGVT